MNSWLITNAKMTNEDIVCKKGIWAIIGDHKDLLYVQDATCLKDEAGVYISEDSINIQTCFYLNRCIYYYFKNGIAYFSNDLRMLLGLEEIPFVVNEEVCRDYILLFTQVEDTPASNSLSFFEGIHKITGNRRVYYSEGKLIDCEWKNKIEFIGEKDNCKSQTVRSIIAEKIDKIDKKERVAIELSGGIDSACILAELIERGFCPSNIYAFIMTFKDCELSDTNDESLAIKLVNYYGINGYIIYGDESLNSLEYSKMNVCNIDGPVSSANYYWLQTLNHYCEELGIHYIFTGNGGDEMLDGSPFIYDEEFWNKPISTIRKFISYNHRKNFLKSLKRQLIKPVLCPYLYYSELWKEHYNPIPSFFSKEQKKREKEARRNFRKQIGESRKLKGWGRRYIYDFSFSEADYLSDFFDETEFINPMLSDSMFAFANSADLERLFDISCDGYYRASKRILRSEYSGIVPEYIVKKEIKTTYNQMSRKMFLNSFPRIYNMFKDGSFVDKIRIIDNAEFIHELTRLYIACADNTTQVGLTFRYMWGVIKLEEWFRYISCGREAVLKKSSTENKDCLMCEVLQHAK